MTVAAEQGIPLVTVAAHLDALLRTADVPDYPGAVNGVQVENRAPITRVATAVDASLRTIQGAVDADLEVLTDQADDRLTGRIFHRHEQEGYLENVVDERRDIQFGHDFLL